jgi:hypothetical protein
MASGRSLLRGIGPLISASDNPPLNPAPIHGKQRGLAFHIGARFGGVIPRHRSAAPNARARSEIFEGNEFHGGFRLRSE